MCSDPIELQPTDIDCHATALEEVLEQKDDMIVGLHNRMNFSKNI